MDIGSLCLTDVQQGMAGQVGIGALAGGCNLIVRYGIFVICSADKAQVIEVTQVIQSVLVTCIVIDVDLRVTFQAVAVIVHMQVSLLILHDTFQVMVVGYADGHGIRVGLAQIGLGVVCQHVAVLIPVERVCAGGVFLTVDMTLGVALLLEDFPSAAQYLVGSGPYGGHTHGNAGTGQDNLGLPDILYNGDAGTEVDVDVDDMTFADGCDVQA